jgi:pSer/pThr/pTyr-binding forkhead associated (FHA) protein
LTIDSIGKEIKEIIEKMTGQLIIIFIQGELSGQKFTMSEGETIIIGRSRRCNIVIDNSNIELQDIPFPTVSRQHLKITYHNNMNIELIDLSANGTWVDNERINTKVITDITTSTNHVVRLGNQAEFILGWSENVE